MNRIGAIIFLTAVLLMSVPEAEAAAGKAVAKPRARFEDVAAGIMSPACPGKLLLDCPSGEGAQLRELVRRKIHAGETKAQIIQYFVDVYGVEVLPQPPAEGFFLTAWLLPFAGVLAGLGVFGVLVWSWSRKGGGEALAGAVPVSQVEAQAGGDAKLENRLKRELDEWDG